MKRISIVLALGACACRQDMHDQPRFEPFEASAFFNGGRSARPQVPGTVAQGELNEDELFFEGKRDGQLATVFPFRPDRAVLERGRERYDIFCSPCHDHIGSGRGMVVKRGFPAPPSFHLDRLREAPPGHFFDVITRGIGRMYDYSDRVPPRDRWAIAAYIQALQRARLASLEDVPPEHRLELEGAP